MAKIERISEAVVDYGMAKADLQGPLVVERDGQPLV